MNLRNFVTFSYALVLAALGLAIYAKVFPSGQIDLVTAFIIELVAQLVFSFAAIYELRYSTRISGNEKYTWAFFLFIMPLPAGLVYFATIRRKMLYN